mmetsp:Transcript_82032/g.171696  ORF Transcript_82032/g.171696 Transcript_82032/m.171696 type:complete len:239 (-) Transcript_82032:133-849(-)|eukprot:CAMPEP_0206551176 /NCGR_PEP_ID=MMETSP0325_2-20121206/15389_1 /ASSEMBLY_ACC=CAM_ASM_000347 /TAXON_ID=2866 /ORGANISM="Crypthecodinium cohnii, Strain Seligo" /LENGTH=238 /DNA_ID=CAMNT_0054050929 /DNA_START=475 /DNA_END=1191 /DNA_ORIENTATION=-
MFAACCCQEEGEPVEVLTHDALNLESPPSAFKPQSPASPGKSPLKAPAPATSATSPNSSAGQPANRTFEVSFQKEEGGLGLVLDAKSGPLAITGIHQGQVLAYNSSAPADKEVKLHDFLIECNGKTDIQDMLSEMKNEKTLTLKIYRSEPFAVRFRKADLARPLGCHFVYTDDSTSLAVKGIAAGPVLDYNNTTKSHKIELQDSVIAINGVEGKPKDMIEVIKSNLELEFVLVRPPRV